MSQVSTTALAPWPTHPLRALVAPRTWLATVHLLVGPFFANLGFTVVITGLALSVGLLPLALLGLVFLVGTAAAARGYGWLERRRFALLLDVHIPDPPGPPAADGLFGRVRALLASGLTWRQLGYCILDLPLSIVLAALALVAWSGPLALIVLPLVQNVSWVWWFTPLVGLALLPLAPRVVKLLAAGDVAVARAMLGPYTAGERVRELEDSRARVVDSAEAERRRIERDLHDGAQQRLVSLAMLLGRAEARYDSDPAGARALLAEGRVEARDALKELRDLTRGIHPPVLTDRGLDAALSGLAGRLPIPVSVDVDVDPRPDATVESIAYFVVAEALTNIAKHAHARAATVSVRRMPDSQGDALLVLVMDDGVGGATLDGGTGLAGLADRVAGVDGRITLDSPPGGPTVLSVELPCGS